VASIAIIIEIRDQKIAEYNVKTGSLQRSWTENAKILYLDGVKKDFK
jgi:hypothetical protein